MSLEKLSPTSQLETVSGQNGHTNGHHVLEQIFLPSGKVIFDRSVAEPQKIALGEAIDVTHIKSTEGPFHLMPSYKVYYPDVVKNALGNLYAEYNRAFKTSVSKNGEWPTDYQYAMAGDGTPVNGWVQIDMVGIPDGFMNQASALGEEQVRETLRGRIFEMENSIAMYQLLQRLFSKNGEQTTFDQEFRASLDRLRQKYEKPIALLAVTDQKYLAMKGAEFGKKPEEPLTNEEVKDLSGFDRFFGPDEFKEYVEKNRGKCDYLLFARTSDPVDKIRKPSTVVRIPLLEDPNTRRVIRANSITFNVDDPQWPVGDPRRINDTKEYLLIMGMAYPLSETMDNIYSEGYKEFLKTGGKNTTLMKAQGLLSEDLKRFLMERGLSREEVSSQEVALRFKPMQNSYGCYGHEDGKIDADLRQSMKKHLRDRGPYVIQPEMKIPVIIDEVTGRSYAYIDRVFFTTDGKNVKFMGGFRSLMPLDSYEAQHGRNHGSKHTVWGEIK